MSLVDITVRLADAFGTHLTTIGGFADADGPGLEYALSVGNPTAPLILTVPGTFDASLFRKDGRIGAWRSVAGRPPSLDGQAIWLIRRWVYGPKGSYTKVYAYHANHLTTRRIIAYNAGTTYTSKSAAAADNQIKSFASQNLGSGIVALDRDGNETQADISAYLAIQANLGLGQSVAKGAARRRLDRVIQDLCEASTTAGTYLACEIVAPTESTLELRTYTQQRGVDHTVGSAQPVILSEDRGNIENVILDIDATNEVTFVVAGGSGEESARLVQTASDPFRIAESPFNRIEQFIEDTNVNDAFQLRDMAYTVLRAGIPIIDVNADLVETAGATRGLHFDLGDLLTVEARGQQHDVRFDAVAVSVQGGKINQSIHLRNE